MSAFVLTFYAGNWKELKYFYKNKFLISDIVLIIFIPSICFAFGGVGAFLGIDGFMGAPYLIISFAPAVIYSSMFVFLDKKKNKRSF